VSAAVSQFNPSLGAFSFDLQLAWANESKSASCRQRLLALMGTGLDELVIGAQVGLEAYI
jgi:hypothetical protein